MKAIIFDFGGVVAKVKVEVMFSDLAKTLGISDDAFHNFRKLHYDNLILGKLSAKEFSCLVQEEFSLTQDVYTLWKETYPRVMSENKEVLELVQELKKNYIVAMLSNANDLHMQVNSVRGLYVPFSPLVISCEVGHIKPTKELLDIMLEKLKLPATECVLIDDREKYLSVPQKLGFSTIHFKNAKQLREELYLLSISC